MNTIQRILRGNRKRDATPNNGVAVWLDSGDLCVPGYTRLSDNPEIMTGCLRIAELIGSMTIYLMSNTDEGDVRIVNELSRMIDITPNGTMTRSQWMTAIVMNLLLHGNGNSVVVPHTSKGILQSMEPIAASRVTFKPKPGSYKEYSVCIDGQPRNPEDVMHFVYNPDPRYLWKGRGVTILLKDIANNLKQAQKTENAFMASEWKPSIIVKVDALTEEFASPEGREKLLQSYVKPQRTGEPWLIPAEQFQVEQVRPLSLADLAIKDTVELDKKTVASVLGVPAFLLGVGDFKRDEWNNFVQTKIRAIALNIQQEMTRALIISPKWYLLLNFWSLMDYDLKSTSDILLAGADRGYVCGDEWRDRMHMSPKGLKEYKVLENYIPVDMIGKQKKLVQDGD
jgi:HK97 family phage portal protein